VFPALPPSIQPDIRLERGVMRRVARGGMSMWVLLLLPFIGLLWVPFYNTVSPSLFGFPFFYWYQLLWVIISAVLTFLAYVVVRRHDIDRGNERRAERDAGSRP
jgi:membrane protein implicated in regulation of membrane protease activity